MAKKILVIDDEEGIQNLLRNMLSSKGYEVDIAGDGEQGLEMALSNPYDLILLDLNLPKLDGQSICTELKFDPNKKDVPIIMLTGRSDIKEKAIGEEVGANEYISKPFEIKALFDVINGYLQ